MTHRFRLSWKLLSEHAMHFPTLDEAVCKGATVLLRADLNVPIHDGTVADGTRIEAVIPTIRELADAGARIVVLSHLGRPGGRPSPDLSLAPVAAALGRSLGGPEIRFAPDCIGDSARSVIDRLPFGRIAMLENLRFHPGEESNDVTFCRQLAALGTLYVNDAFSVSHRAHASVAGITAYLPAFAGRLMQAELAALATALERPARPVLAIVGGAKISTKLALLLNLVGQVDHLIVGGGMANTFLLAQGHPVGTSLAEHDMVDIARQILTEALRNNCHVHIQTDAVAARTLGAGVPTRIIPVESVPEDCMVLDAGPGSVAAFNRCVDQSRTVVWNGPLGAFEVAPFDLATTSVARHVARRTREGRLASVAGGGDTVRALNQAGVAGDFSYLSMAGGAFLEWLEGKTLPGVAALEGKR